MRAACELLMEQGLDAFSMRKVAARLGIEAMSLYHHVANKEALLDLVHEQLVSQLDGSRGRQGDELANLGWVDWSKGLAYSFRDLLRNNPQSIALFYSRSAIAPGSLKVVEDSIQGLLLAGFTPAESLFTFQTIFCFVLGHAAFHYSRRTPQSWAQDGSYQELPALGQLPPLEQLSVEEEFEFGLSALLNGLATRRSPQ